MYMTFLTLSIVSRQNNAKFRKVNVPTYSGGKGKWKLSSRPSG